ARGAPDPPGEKSDHQPNSYSKNEPRIRHRRSRVSGYCSWNWMFPRLAGSSEGTRTDGPDSAPPSLILRDRNLTYWLAGLRPGFPGVPPRSSFDGLWWFELPGSQTSGPLPTPWLHLPCSLSPS